VPSVLPKTLLVSADKYSLSALCADLLFAFVEVDFCSLPVSTGGCLLLFRLRILSMRENGAGDEDDDNDVVVPSAEVPPDDEVVDNAVTMAAVESLSPGLCFQS